MNDIEKIVRIAAITIGAILLVYFGLGVLRHGAPKVGSAAGSIQEKF
jgi:hypothetical protein